MIEIWVSNRVLPSPISVGKSKCAEHAPDDPFFFVFLVCAPPSPVNAQGVIAGFSSVIRHPCSVLFAHLLDLVVTLLRSFKIRTEFPFSTLCHAWLIRVRRCPSAGSLCLDPRPHGLEFFGRRCYHQPPCLAVWHESFVWSFDSMRSCALCAAVARTFVSSWWYSVSFSAMRRINSSWLLMGRDEKRELCWEVEVGIGNSLRVWKGNLVPSNWKNN